MLSESKQLAANGFPEPACSAKTAHIKFGLIPRSERHKRCREFEVGWLLEEKEKIHVQPNPWLWG